MVRTQDLGVTIGPGHPLAQQTIGLRRGYDDDVPFASSRRNDRGIFEIKSSEMTRLVLDLGDRAGSGAERVASYRGYSRAGSERTDLPIGSSLDRATGLFAWLPGPGFIGRYELVFERTD